MHVERAARRQRAGCEQQRITGQERGHDQPRLAEDDREQDRVQPRAVVGGEDREVLVEVQDDVEKLGE